MRQIWDDLRFGLRSLARSPGFTAAALVTLALAIGANATLFSLADALYLRLLDVPEASRLVHVYQTRRAGQSGGDRFYPLSLADYFDYGDQARSFESLAAHYSSSPMHLVIDGEPLAVSGSVVTASYFTVLRITPALGRFFGPEEDTVRDRDAVAVISHDLWQRRFDGNPQVIGRAIQVNGRAFTVIGVASHGFDGVFNGGTAPQVWIPTAMFRYGYRYCQDGFARDCTIVEMLGRLKPQATIADAQVELSMIAARLRAAYPGVNDGRDVIVLPVRGASPERQAGHERIVPLLLGGVGLLLLIACANVAGLLLARGTTRRKEVAIRLALGAGRGRIVRHFLAESALLTVGGGALGLVLTLWSKELVASFYAADYAGRPLSLDIEIGGWPLIGTALLCALTTVLCGLMPALQSARADVLPALKAESGAAGRPRSRMRDGLVVAQVALSGVLLVGAALLVRSVLEIHRGPGVDVDRVLVLRLRPSLVEYDSERARAFQREVIRRLESLPGVEAASPSENFPLLIGGGVQVALSGERETFGANAGRVGDGYFRVMGQPLLAGRDFNDSDGPATMPVVVVDDLLASRLGGVDQVVGRLMTLDGRPHEVVGVVRAAHYRTSQARPVPFVYRNYWQQSGKGFSADSRTHVRVAGDAHSMMARIRGEIAAIDRNVPISEDYPLRDRLRFHFQPVRLVMTLLVSFGVVALVLTIVGLYGLVAFVASTRTREIAIRLAVGATRRDVRRLVVGHGARLAVIGAAVGFASAFAASRVLAGLLYGVHAHDAATFGIVATGLVGVALCATWLPARRASRVDPAAFLRQE